MKTFTNKAFDPQTKRFLVSESYNSFANGVQYFLERVGDLNSEGRVREVVWIVKESESTKKVVLGVEDKSNITASTRVTEQILSNNQNIFSQLWVKSGNSNPIE